MTVTIRDVANAAGVSAATVSRVVNETTADYPVRVETRDRVLAAIDDLGYRPNEMARSLLLKKSGLVGLIVPDISNPYYPDVSRGVEDVANAHDYKVMFCSTDRDTDKARSYVDALLLKRVDGIIVVGGGDEVRLSSETIGSYDTKVVLIGRPSGTFPTVQIDNVGAARTATEHLLGLGHERIGLIAASSESNSVRERLRGYRESLEGRGIVFDDGLVIDGDFTEAGGYDAAARLLEVDPPPTGIFAANDRMALGAMAAIADRGLRVPDDVAIVGFDDVPMSSYLRPALTTVSISSAELGARAMEIVLGQVNGDQTRKRVRVQTELVVRDSCGSQPDRKRAGRRTRRPRPNEGEDT